MATASNLADWLDARSDKRFLSTVTVTEITDGIAKLRRSGGLVRADRLDDAAHEPLGPTTAKRTARLKATLIKRTVEALKPDLRR